MIRRIRPDEKEAMLQLVRAGGLFAPEETDEIEKRFVESSAERSADLWIVYEDQGFEGLAYCVPEPMTKGSWNLLMLLVHPDKRGRGQGTALVAYAENLIRAQGGRLLIVETSGVEGFENTRRFYAGNGFAEIARVPDFYDVGDDKIILSKSLT